MTSTDNTNYHSKYYGSIMFNKKNVIFLIFGIVLYVLFQYIKLMLIRIGDIIASFFSFNESEIIVLRIVIYAILFVFVFLVLLFVFRNKEAINESKVTNISYFIRKAVFRLS